MKIRTGFVSNSSSSSFIVIAPKITHERIMDKLHPYIRKVISHIATYATIADVEIVYMAPTISSEWDNDNDWGIDFSGEKPYVDDNGKIVDAPQSTNVDDDDDDDVSREESAYVAEMRPSTAFYTYARIINNEKGVVFKEL